MAFPGVCGVWPAEAAARLRDPGAPWARASARQSLATGKFAFYPKFPGLFSVLKTQLLPLPKLLVYRHRYLS